jgi:4-alpha-glucanotransferase
MADKKNRRSAGVVLHPVSLPGKWGIGDFGENAYRFIDKISDAGLKIWQILPLTPTGNDGCPYNSYSAFAGNELLIDLEKLQKEDLLDSNIKIPNFDTRKVEYDRVIKFKTALIETAAANFHNIKDTTEEFQKFLKDNKWWLDDYVLFMAISDKFNNVSWKLWAEDFRLKDEQTLKNFIDENSYAIFRYQFGQWVFFNQWNELRSYAKSRNISIMGDIPIFLSFDSADVWANQEIFMMKDGEMVEVSGVPPDYFSKEGQLWGNPLYDWNKLQKTGFKWWIDRFRQNLSMYDSIRLDHFRGFSEYWAVPSNETTAINGKWKKTPGKEFFNKLFSDLGKFPVVVEDLGNIDEKVKTLRDDFGFAGMKVLQFAFYDGTNHEFLPHNFETTNCVIYTGTHDNDTTFGWYWNASSDTRDFINHYIASDGRDIHWKMIRVACSSIAEVALFPLQDILGWGSDCRFNTPGTIGDQNWSWRFEEDELKKEYLDVLRGILIAYNRV